ncbi:DNA-binding protein [candidate division WWE3 bacterium RIFCSPHIGHO2_01_FULL_40_23]|uniref:DNA-binding protein n=1 Tax=candidate division WWE3 bacterium RIFCSPLOWO2_01_FULL_41_18 TaxID=1802625 RepID=A0A1F4VEF3_UNCKA|nr:MAG: DNA-binding protein [candidate division WWE3 bacterium RIFCSPHIGHO2_01_FULL_40_23]OGC55083.1 MAG: DNA-binding protein [candidate division WWE3 bacterium RIFCSPLOWO2_01_FULL_41_18]
MTKADLIDMVADKAGLTKADSQRALDSLSDGIAKSLSKGEKVTWTGFGTFEVRQRAARMGRNPQTGAPLRISASKTPAFKAGKGLKDAVK